MVGRGVQLLPLLLLLFARAGGATAVAASQKGEPLYKDATQPISARVADLLGRMTLEEKVNQTLNDFADGAFGGGIPKDVKLQEAIASEGMRYLFKFCTTDLPTCINTINHFQTLARHNTRLGIPISFSEETLHGSLFAPQLPMPINLGSSWNLSLVEQGFKHTAAALTKVGGNIGLSPVVNMFPDPRFGRLQEGFSEDPFLSGQMGIAAVRGLQGPQNDVDAYLNNPNGVSCVVKHYLGYGHAEQGGIDGGPATLDEQTLRERYLAPWKAIADEGVLCIFVRPVLPCLVPRLPSVTCNHEMCAQGCCVG
jgi:beta-glucosidase